MLPNFLCIGTYRAGTTWLYKVLREHPDVFVPDEKEIMFFSNHYLKGIEWYEKFFNVYQGQKYAAEICPTYLSNSKAPERIRRHLHDVKLAVILRNPVDQIFSMYNLFQLRGYTKKDLFSFLSGDKTLLNHVLYFRHLSRYLQFFDSQKIIVMFYEDLKDDPKTFLANLYSFLDIKCLYSHSIYEVQNRGRTPRSLIIERIIASTGDLMRRKGLLRLKILLNKFRLSDMLKALNTASRSKNDISAEFRSIINKYVEEDKRCLSKLINRDLSFWK